MRIVALFLCLLAGSAAAQTITASGTITDTDGNAWDNGAWSATLVSPNGPPMYLGNPVPIATFYGMLDASGVMSSSGQFYNTGTVMPTGAFYTINMCSATTAPCSKFNTQVVTGAGLISSVNANIVAPRFAAFIGSLGYYADSLSNRVYVRTRSYGTGTV